MMDDAAFYACNSLVTDRFLLTTAFNLLFTRPLKAGPVIAEGRWVSGQRRVFVGEARLIDARRRGGGARHRHLHALAHPARPASPAIAAGVMAPRLASSVLVGALLRRAEDEGGFGAVLAKGDPTAGAIVVILPKRAEMRASWSGCCSPTARYAWQDARQDVENEEEFKSSSRGAGNSIPDLWMLELDIPSAERFAAEMNAVG